MNPSNLFLPDPAELLLKARRPYHQLCCFGALSARRKSSTVMEADGFEEEFSGPVLVYRPQSAIFPSPSLSAASTSASLESSRHSSPMATTVRRVNSEETGVSTREPSSSCNLFSLNGTLTPPRNGRNSTQQLVSPSRLSINTASLPTLVSSMLRWRSSSPANSAHAFEIATRRSRQLRMPLQILSGDASNRIDAVIGQDQDAQIGLQDGAPANQPIVSNGHGDSRSEAASTDDGNGDADEALDTDHRDSFQGHTDTRQGGDNDSNIVELYMDSILELLPNELDEVESDVADDAVERKLAIDIDELIRLGEVGDCDYETENETATAESQLVELARGVRLGEPEDGETDDGAAATAATPARAVRIDCVDGRRRLSATGSEPATGEFHFIRARALQASPTAPATLTLATTPRLRNLRGAGTLTIQQQQQPVPSLDSNAAAAATLDRGASSRRRRFFPRRRQSYALTGWLPTDNSLTASVVLTGARHSWAAPTLQEQQQQQQQQHLPPPTTGASAQPVRAIVFHPPSQVNRATYLANYLASSGQPACLWSDALESEAAAKKPELGKQRGRLFSGLLRRQSIRPASGTQLGDALAACARRDHLPIVLLPACGPADDRFLRRLRESLASQPRLAVGLVVVVAGPSEASHWAAAAGAETPTQVIRDEFAVEGAAGGSSRRRSARPLGPECCRQVLAAARRSSALASAHRVL